MLSQAIYHPYSNNKFSLHFAVFLKTYLCEGVLTTPIEAEPFIIKSGVVAISIDGTGAMALVICTLPLSVLAGAEMKRAN